MASSTIIIILGHDHRHHHHNSSSSYSGLYLCELTSHSLHPNMFNPIFQVDYAALEKQIDQEQRQYEVRCLLVGLIMCTWNLIEGQQPSFIAVYWLFYVCSLLKCCENEYSPSIDEIETSLIWHKLIVAFLSVCMFHQVLHHNLFWNLVVSGCFFRCFQQFRRLEFVGTPYGSLMPWQ